MFDANVVKNILFNSCQPFFDGQAVKEGYRLKPYAKTTPPKAPRSSPKAQMSDSESEFCEYLLYCKQL